MHHSNMMAIVVVESDSNARTMRTVDAHRRALVPLVDDLPTSQCAQHDETRTSRVCSEAPPLEDRKVQHVEAMVGRGLGDGLPVDGHAPAVCVFDEGVVPQVGETKSSTQALEKCFDNALGTVRSVFLNLRLGWVNGEK